MAEAKELTEEQIESLTLRNGAGEQIGTMCPQCHRYSTAKTPTLCSDCKKENTASAKASSKDTADETADDGVSTAETAPKE